MCVAIYASVISQVESWGGYTRIDQGSRTFSKMGNVKCKLIKNHKLRSAFSFAVYVRASEWVAKMEKGSGGSSSKRERNGKAIKVVFVGEF